MSGTTSDSIPTFTISIGTAGTFTNDSSVDIASQVNAEIKEAPAGDNIALVFNPGTYGVGSPILVPSNSKVIGDNATLQYIQVAGSVQNFGLIANADAYYGGIYTKVNLIDGTSTTLQTWTGTYDSGTQTMGGSVPAIVDTNISVQGMTFVMGDAHVFGTWFTNAQNIDVQNNSYIGGTDGNAFVNVVNGLVASNLAIGQSNAAFDDWNGPTAVTIEDNATYMGATPNSGWSVLLNSTPSGDAANPGNASNDGVIDNLFSTGAQGQNAVNANALTAYGFTTESMIVQQGNIDSINGMPNQMGMYTGNPMQNLFVENDITSGINDSGSNPQNSYGYVVLESTATGPDVTNDTSMTGNVAEGDFSDGQGGIIQNSGNNPTTVNNLEIGAGASTRGITTNAWAGTFSQVGNMAVYSGGSASAVVKPEYDIIAPASIFAVAGTATAVPGIAIQDLNSTDTLSITLVAQFGTLAIPAGGSSVTSENINGENAYVLTGSVSDLNQELSGLSYISNAAGWDDSIDMIVSNGTNIIADRYLPIIDLSGTDANASLITLTPSELSAIGLQPDIVNGTIYGPDFSGSAVLALSGDNTISMGTSVSVVLLGAGTDTVTGGINTGYISTGEGSASIDLDGGGNFTIAGGPGTLSVNAAVGNNLIESGAGNAIITAGSGNDILLGGLGNLSVTSGSGALLLETLPQDGGSLTGTIGTGGGTIYALSGNAMLSTTTLAADIIYLGLGNDTLQSAGNDVIYTGAGNDTINASTGGTDVIIGGTGEMTFIGGANPAIIDPAASSKILAHGGNMTILSGGNFSMTIDAMPGVHREITLPDLSDGIRLSGYHRALVKRDMHEIISGNMITISLGDGTQIQLPEIEGYRAEIIHPPSNLDIQADVASAQAAAHHRKSWELTMVANGSSQLATGSVYTASQSSQLSDMNALLNLVH